MPIARSGLSYLNDILNNSGELLEVWEVAEITRSSERTVRRWLANGKLAGLRRGSRGLLIPRQALIDFLDPANNGQ